MKPSKLCRRTYFLQTGTAPTVSEMARELGPDLAAIIIDTLQPSQRSAVQPDCIVLPDDSSSRSHDIETVRGLIHEHILQIGGNISHRVDGYWRKRLKRTAAAGISSEEVDFIKFDCRQKIAIARDEERKRYDALLEGMEKKLEMKFFEEKGNLHRSYAEARELWGKFVCQKVRKQAKDMLCKIASYYRTKLEREVTCRMQQEKNKIIKEMEQIVKTAVDQQRRIDERAIQWLVNQYEELLKFISEYNECLDTVEMTREICRLHFGRGECHSTQVSQHSLAYDNHAEDRETNSSPVDDLEEGVQIALASLSKCNVFVVNQCLPEPVPEPSICDEEDILMATPEELSVSEDYNSANEGDGAASSIEKITIGGLTYAQPKYYKKIYNDIFPEFVMSWEKISPSETSDELRNVGWNFTNQSMSSSSDTTNPVHSETIQSEPSYRESYDPIAEIHDVLGSKDDNLPADEMMPADEEFAELFDLSKFGEEISSIAESFSIRYIRATSEDFDAMFRKSSEMEP